MEAESAPGLSASVAPQALTEQRQDGPGAYDILPGTQLDLRLGNPLILRPLFSELHYEAKVVGLVPFEYFIVQARMPQDTLARLQTSSTLLTRLNLGGTVYGFHTQMLNRVAVPGPLLFLSYPITVKRQLLRRSGRVGVAIPSSIHGPFGDHEGMVLDMARSGCRFSARSALNSPLRRARPGERVVLNCHLLRHDRPLTTPLVLRRVEERKGLITLGGQFEGLNSGGQRQVEDYVQRVLVLSNT